MSYFALKGGNMSEISDKVREMFAAGDTVRDAGLTTPEDVERFDDICYGNDLKWQVLDVYRPKKCKGEKLPVLINMHGGGWVYGDKERYQFYCMSLAQYGFAVVNFTYRLAPEFKFPAPAEDANLVAKWVIEHADEYGFDTTKIVAAGDSAGATLLYQYATICTSEAYGRMYAFEVPKGFHIQAILLNCGQYEIAVSKEPGDLTTALMHEYLPEGGTTAELEILNAMPYMTKEFPPTYLMTANEDFLCEQAPMMKKRLEELEIPHEFTLWGDAEHPLQHVFHLNIKTEVARECNRMECEFLEKHNEKRAAVAKEIEISTPTLWSQMSDTSVRKALL